MTKDVPFRKTRRAPVWFKNIAGISEDEFRALRPHTVGGSDAAAAQGYSPFKTLWEVWCEKSFILPILPDNRNQFAIKRGHLLEALIAETVAEQYDLELFKADILLLHPEHQFISGNPDYYCRKKTGEIGLIEVKTSSWRNRWRWEDNKVPFHNYQQGVQYMAIDDVDFVLFACLLGDDASDIEVRYVERDYKNETELILDEQYFWYELVLPGREPVLAGDDPDKVLDTIRRFTGPADKRLPAINLPQESRLALAQILELKRRKSELDAVSRKLEKQIKTLQAPIVKELGKHCAGRISLDGALYEIVYKPTGKPGIPKDKLESLRINHPLIYNEYITISDTRSFAIKECA